MSNSIHFTSIRFGNNVVYDTNLTGLTNQTVVFQNTLGINTSYADNNYRLYVNGNTKVVGTVTASNLVYGSSNLQNIVVNQLDLQQSGDDYFIKAPSLAINARGFVATQKPIIQQQMNIHGTVVTSNLLFYGQNTIANSNIYSKPVQQSFYLSQATSNFTLSYTGDNSLTIIPQVFYNGFHLSYSNQASNDFEYSFQYDNPTNETTVSITLAFPANSNDIVDIFVSPNYPTNDDPALLFQYIKLGVWSSNQAVFTSNQVGIYTSPVAISPLHALTVPQIYTSQIVASNMTIYDIHPDHLVTSNIDNETTLTITSNLTLSTSNLILTGDLRLENANIEFSSNVILQAIYNQPISIMNVATNVNSFSNCVEDKLLVGSSLPLGIERVNVVGSISAQAFLKNALPYTIPSNWNTGAQTSNIYYSGNVGINTTASSSALHIQGNVSLSNTIPISELSTTQKVYSPIFVGMVGYFAGATPQPGWLVCNGNYVSSNVYSELYTAIQTNYGSLSNEFFKLPDLRGEFIRSYSDTRSIGSYQAAAIEQHSHDWNFQTQTLPINNTSNNTFVFIAGLTSNAVGNPLHSVTATETRPRNVALLPCIFANTI